MWSAAFLSTLSLRRATAKGLRENALTANFYPRSPYGERRQKQPVRHPAQHFYPRSPYGERPFVLLYMQGFKGFLSTLSLRRATLYVRRGPKETGYFYPRSPYGERRSYYRSSGPFKRFLSTLSLRRATDVNKPVFAVTSISIHALLTESDLA